MRTKFCDLIVISPASPRILKIQVTRPAVAILCAAFVVSFFTSVALTTSFAPEKLNDAGHARLQAENAALEIENKTLEFRTQKLDAEISELEALSERISLLLEAE